MLAFHFCFYPSSKFYLHLASCPMQKVHIVIRPWCFVSLALARKNILRMDAPASQGQWQDVASEGLQFVGIPYRNYTILNVLSFWWSLASWAGEHTQHNVFLLTAFAFWWTVQLPSTNCKPWNHGEQCTVLSLPRSPIASDSRWVHTKQLPLLTTTLEFFQPFTKSFHHALVRSHIQHKMYQTVEKHRTS